MNETTLTITGNLTSDPELRFTPSGTAVANLTVAATPRRFDKASGGWVDGEALFLRCTVWRQAAGSLTCGARVVVTGRLRSSTFETREGDKRTTLELDVEDIGASLTFATVTLHRAQRTSGEVDRPTDNDEPPF
jgi:single-strand DNA-binding protein